FDALKANSLSMRKAKWRADDLTKVTYEATADAPDSYLAGWPTGTQAATWRVDARDIFRHALSRHAIHKLVGDDGTYVDWLGPYLHLERVMADREDFTRFWLTDVEDIRMPRNWLR